MITQENIPYSADEIKAMVKTCEKYNKALDRAKDMLAYKEVRQEDMEYLFPELEESEDEKIKREIVAYINELADLKNEKIPTKWLTWLEKKKQKFVESEVSITESQPQPKFKVGDWVVSNNNGEVWQIGVRYTEEGQRIYLYNVNDVMMSITLDELNNDYHLWTIHDAMDGDVLSTENFIFIFKNIDDGNGVHYYCQYEISKHEDDNQFDIALPQSLMGRVGNSISRYSPATKEQRNLLFQKMKEAGYEWDAQKKDLKEIVPKKLYADKVIAWLVANICDFEYYVKRFKEDFEL